MKFWVHFFPRFWSSGRSFPEGGIARTNVASAFGAALRKLGGVQATRRTDFTSDPDGVDPVFGPVVVIDSVTGVVTAPAASEAGLNTQFVNAGWLLHAKLTAELNVPLPTGAAENI